MKNGPVPAYETLSVVERKLESGEVCPITQAIPKKPVLCGSAVYEYDALIQHYRMNGKNPVNRTTINLEGLRAGRSFNSEKQQQLNGLSTCSVGQSFSLERSEKGSTDVSFGRLNQ